MYISTKLLSTYCLKINRLWLGTQITILKEKRTVQKTVHFKV